MDPHVQLRKYSAKPDGLSEPSRRFQTDGIDSDRIRQAGRQPTGPREIDNNNAWRHGRQTDRCGTAVLSA
jgi:hypothetical protein